MYREQLIGKAVPDILFRESFMFISDYMHKPTRFSEKTQLI